jgi:hypothetical protein
LLDGASLEDNNDLPSFFEESRVFVKEDEGVDVLVHLVHRLSLGVIAQAQVLTFPPRFVKIDYCDHQAMCDVA